MTKFDQLEELKKRSNKLKLKRAKLIKEQSKKTYNEIKTALMDKDKIDYYITDAINNNKNKLVIFKMIQDTINLSDLIEIPRYKNEKSLLDQLREIYPLPYFKVCGKLRGDMYKDTQSQYYYEYSYQVIIKWKTIPTNKSKCVIL